MPKKKKGKKSSSKKSKKAQPKHAATYKPPPLTPEEAGEILLRRMRHWLTEHTFTVTRFLDACDREEMTKDEVAIAIRHLQVPLSVDQLKRLIKILDSSRSEVIKTIDLQDLSKKSDQEIVRLALQAAVQIQEEEEAAAKEKLAAEREKKGTKKGKKKGEDKPKVQPPPPEMLPCSQCGLLLAEPRIDKNPRYVMLQLTLATFKGLRTHPGHFTRLIIDSSSIEGIRETIKTHLDGSIHSVAVFNSPKCTKDSYIPPTFTLAECGIVGGPRSSPTSHQLYYDYIPIIVDCPILMSDTGMRDIVM